MGLDIKEAFEIDAAKILAKLHCKARTAQPKCVFFNSGVTDDQKGLKPEDCEGAKITFKTDQKAYELAVMAPEQQAECNLKYSAEDILEKMTAPDAGKKSEDAKSGETEPGETKPGEEPPKATENPDEKKVDEDMPSFMRFLHEEDPPEKKDDAGKKDDDIQIDPFIEPKDATDEVKEMVKENNKALAECVEEYKAVYLKYLQDYMKLFAGEDEAKKITDKQVAVVYLPEGADPEKFEYKDGVIEGMSDQDRAKGRAEQVKKDSAATKIVLNGFCCKVPYILNMEA